MPPTAPTRAALRLAGDALAAQLGLVAHRLAGAARRLGSATASDGNDNIAVVCSSFLRYGIDQAVGLQQIGLHVTLYYVDVLNEFAGERSDRDACLDRARAAGVEVVRIPRRRLRRLLPDTLDLHRDLRRRKIGFAVVQWHVDPRYAMLGLRWPVALIAHDPQPHSGDTASSFQLPLRAIARWTELTSRCLVVHAEQLIEQLRPIVSGLPVAVVPHGAIIQQAPSPIPRERQLLVFGRLFAYKGVDTALAAFAVLPSELADATLVVAGRGPLAETARGQPNVELREGYVTDAEVDRLLDDARLVLLPYKDATQSGVGLLAVARGIPCIVSAAGGLPELVRAASPSLVVPPDDPRRLADAIAANVDHEEQLREAVHRHAREHFAWPVVAQRLLDELKRLGCMPARPST